MRFNGVKPLSLPSSQARCGAVGEVIAKKLYLPTVFTSSTTFGGPPSPKGKVWERWLQRTDKPKFEKLAE